MRKEDPAPYPARPPLILLANRENSFLRMATPKTVFVDRSWLLLLLKRQIYTIHLRSSFRFGHSSQTQTFQLPATLANGILLNAWLHNCIPRSCDYSVNVRHVQPPLLITLPLVHARGVNIAPHRLRGYCNHLAISVRPSVPTYIYHLSESIHSMYSYWNTSVGANGPTSDILGPMWVAVWGSPGPVMCPPPNASPQKKRPEGAPRGQGQYTHLNQ